MYPYMIEKLAALRREHLILEAEREGRDAPMATGVMPAGGWL